MVSAISVAQAHDIPALHALVESAYRGESAKAGWTHEADMLGGQRTDIEALAEMIADPRQTILLLEAADGVLLGCVQVVDRGEGLAYMGMLSVRPELQAAGFGRLLIEAAESHAREALKAARMEMTVIRQRPELIAWYARRGYLLMRREAPFPYGDDRFGLPKRDDLVFVVMAKAL